MIRTLIIDDSAMVREVIKDFLEEDGSFEVVGEAENGLEGIAKMRELKPDLITIDIQMPLMDGIETIPKLRAETIAPIVVITTQDTAQMAYQASLKGALEFYGKDNFTAKTSAPRRAEILETLKKISGVKAAAPKAAAAPEASPEARKIAAVVVASSTGGPKALSQLCEDLPADFPVPVAIVQHNSSGFDKGFAQWLGGSSKLKVALAEEGKPPEKGTIYIAPTDRHLVVLNGRFAFDDGALENNQKPAADVLFRSAAKEWGAGLVSVVLTGMGADGAEGTRAVKKAGGVTIAQDESTSMIYGMPKAAVETGCVDLVLPMDKIADAICKIADGKKVGE